MDDSLAISRANNIGAMARRRRFVHNAEAKPARRAPLDDGILEYFSVSRATEIRWSHATNSAEALAEALTNSVHMIEADILMGTTMTEPETCPIMAHPPQTSSNLSFEEFILSVTNHSGSKKGVKLDFKDPEAVIPCLKFLKTLEFHAPVVINADIWNGPGHKTKVRFIPSEFFDACKQYGPTNVVLSVGWSTGKNALILFGCGGYRMYHVEEALGDIANAYPWPERCPPITFPLQAILARQMSEAARKKLFAAGSITLWGEARDSDTKWASKLTDGAVYIDTAPAGWQANYLVSYTAPVLLCLVLLLLQGVVFF